METRGFVVDPADSVAEGIAQIGRAPPAFAVVDLRLGDGNGLDVVSALKRKRPEARAIVLTGYGNIATAVAAVKAGRGGLSLKARRCRRCRRGLARERHARSPSCRKIRCRPTACAGSTSSASTRCATATSPKPRAG